MHPFFVFIVYVVNKAKMNILKKIFHDVKDKDSGKTGLRCFNLFAESALNVGVFCSLSIACLTKYDLYENESLVITLKVEHDGVIENWLEMKKSTIRHGGFRVFALL